MSPADDRFVLRGDAPADVDEFGFTEMATAVARAIVLRVTGGGYVIGVEGKWGSGKTTFVKYVEEAIRQTSLDHHIIRFEPWLVGARNALLSEFFRLLAEKIDAIADPVLAKESTRVRNNKRTRLGDKLRQYGELAAVTAIPVAGIAAGHPILTAVAVGLNTYKALSALVKSPATSIETLHTGIVSDLRELGQRTTSIRICVIIDDLDRLECSEAIEILRLVKKVADFPLLTYLICFDKDILASHVREVLHAGTGEDFLEKIFQHIVSVPPQEAFALRRLLKRGLAECCPDEMVETLGEQVERSKRKEYLFDRWAGNLLSMPRDVARLLDAVKFGWPIIEDRGDFVDYVWLQLVKLRKPALYSWVQEYVSTIGAYRDGGMADETDIDDQSNKLRSIMTEMKWGDRLFISGFDHFLPGLKEFVMKPSSARVLDFQPGELERFEREARLGSPSHWRLYFSFEQPSYALADQDIAEFRRNVVSNPLAAVATLKVVTARAHDKSGHYLDVLLDRLLGLSLTTQEAAGVAFVCADEMDDLARIIRRQTIGGRVSIWNKASDIVGRCVLADILNVFNSGRSLNWLAGTLRRLASAQIGEHSGNPIAADVTARDAAAASLIARLRNLGIREIFRQPEPLVTLQCWSVFGNRNELQTLIADAMSSDDGFLEGLEAMRSWVLHSQKGIYSPLDSEVLANFLDADAAVARLKKIADQQNGEGEQKSRALALMSVLE